MYCKKLIINTLYKKIELKEGKNENFSYRLGWSVFQLN